MVTRGSLFHADDIAGLRAAAAGIVKGPFADALIARVAQARARVDKERKGLSNTFKSFFSASSGPASPSKRASRVVGLPSSLLGLCKGQPGAEVTPEPALYSHDSRQMEAMWLAHLC